MRRILPVLLILALAGASLLVRSAQPRTADAANTWTELASTGSTSMRPQAFIVNTQSGGQIFLYRSGWASPLLYHPGANSWSNTAPMNNLRNGGVAVQLSGFRILVTGGVLNPNGPSVTTGAAEIYDPMTNVWTPVASMNEARERHTAVVLQGGDVMVAGGYGPANQHTEVYHVATNTWELLPPTGWSYESKAILLGDGRVLSVGGSYSSTIGSFVFNPATGVWTPVNSTVGVQQDRASLTLLVDGRVLLAGGDNLGGGEDHRAFTFDHNTDTWTEVASMPSGHYGHTATRLSNGGVLVAGGYGPGPLNGAWIYNPSTDAWSTVANMNDVRSGHTALAVTGLSVLVTGGDYLGDKTELYQADGALPPPDPATVTPTLTSTPTPCPGACPTFTPTNSPTGTPTPSPTNTSSVPPDLIVTSIVGRSQFSCTTPAGVDVTVKNQSIFVSAGASTTRVQSSGGTENISTPALGPGQSVTLMSYVVGITSGDTYTATADINGAVSETNETNNSLSATMSISSQPTCTPTPTHTTSPATFTPTPTATPCGGPDSDGDTVPDCADNCPSDANQNQANNDRNFIDVSPPKVFDDITRAMSDNLGDVCDPDDDNDGRSDVDELAGTACGAFTTPTDDQNADTDGDFAIDGAECARGTDPSSVASRPQVNDCANPPGADSDGDRIPAFREACAYGTLDTNADTDGDGCPDGKEVASINADRAVNSSDLSQIAQSFMSPLTYHSDFDMNHDGTINSIDIGLVAQNFGNCP